jgi:hypothetical protein
VIGTSNLVAADAFAIVNSIGRQFRIVRQAYGVIMYSDDTNFYLMTTNFNDPWGSWNGLRPLYFDLSNGSVWMQHGLSVNGGNLQINHGALTLGAVGPTEPGDISLARTDNPATGAIFFGNTGGHYIYWDSAQFQIIGPATIAGATTITGNVNITGQYLINGVPIGGGAIGFYGNGNYVASRPNVNFVAGGSITPAVADDPPNNTVTVYFNYVSDQRVKQNIRELAGGLDVIGLIRPVEFEFNGLGGTRAGQRACGVIAQELGSVLPGAIESYHAKLHPEDAEATELLAFVPNEILFQLVLAAQQLDRRLNVLEQNGR